MKGGAKVLCHNCKGPMKLRVFPEKETALGVVHKIENYEACMKCGVDIPKINGGAEYYYCEDCHKSFLINREKFYAERRDDEKLLEDISTMEQFYHKLTEAVEDLKIPSDFRFFLKLKNFKDATLIDYLAENYGKLQTDFYKTAILGQEPKNIDKRDSPNKGLGGKYEQWTREQVIMFWIDRMIRNPGDADDFVPDTPLNELTVQRMMNKIKELQYDSLALKKGIEEWRNKWWITPINYFGCHRCYPVRLDKESGNVTALRSRSVKKSEELSKLKEELIHPQDWRDTRDPIGILSELNTQQKQYRENAANAKRKGAFIPIGKNSSLGSKPRKSKKKGKKGAKKKGSKKGPKKKGPKKTSRK